MNLSALLCLLFCHLFRSLECRIFEPDVTLLFGRSNTGLFFPDVLQNRNFGFGVGGSLDFELECQPTTYKSSDMTDLKLWLLGCTPSNKEEFSGSVIPMQTCQKLDSSSEVETNFTVPCQAIPFQQLAHSFKGNYFKAHYGFDKDAYMGFLLLQCPNHAPNQKRVKVTEVYCKGRFVLMNNYGQSELSKDEKPLLPIYKVLLLIWVILLALWIANWFKFRRYSNHLHKLLFVAPSFKFLLLTLCLVWWEHIAATGYENTSLETCHDMVQSIEVATLFISMMLAAEGWCVIRPHISSMRCILILVIFVVLLGSLMCVIWVHSYFLAFSVCGIVFVVYRALKWCSNNLKYLTQLLLHTAYYIRAKRLRFTHVSIIEQLAEKRNIYLRLRLICSVYILIFAIVLTMSTFLTEYTWARMLASEITEIYVFVSFGMIFRLRNFGPFENIEPIQRKENSVVILLPFPNGKWPKRQKLALGKPHEDCSDLSDEDSCDEDKT